MNSGDEAKPPRNRRRLSAEERVLWRGVARSITPLRSAPAELEEREAAPVAARKPPPKFAGKPKAVAPAPLPVQTPLTAPPPALFSRRQKKRVARGADAIDGRLDLHGLTQAEAHDALFGFLMQAQARGARLVLVITGKGGADPHSGRGVLKRQVPMWLSLPAFRACVTGFEDAAIGHGGGGALYVRMRRARD
jgi:DNA-nicking Smr family endonuclease